MRRYITPFSFGPEIFELLADLAYDGCAVCFACTVVPWFLP